MIITWYGQLCFKIQSGSSTVIFNPFSNNSGLTPPKIEAQMVLVSMDSATCNNIATLKGSPFIADSPGEYEYQKVRVQGISSYSENAAKINTIYILQMEDMRVVHLGAFSQASLTEEQVEQIGGTDILIVPVGGGGLINAEQAVEVINQIEPRIVIPSYFRLPSLKEKLDSVDDFLKEIGQKDVEVQEKLTIKKNTLPQEEDKMMVVVLKI